jgi:hypothetical protein
MKTGLFTLWCLSFSALAVPILQRTTNIPSSTTSLDSTVGASSNTSNPKITFANAQSDPEEVAAAIYNETITEISNKPTDPGVSANGFEKGGNGGEGVGGGGAPNSPLNVLLAAVGKIPIVGKELTAIGDVLTSIETALAQDLNVQTTQNEVGCTAMTVIFARGTTEPGNVGLVTGPPFFDALNAMLGANAVTIQGVNYGASIEGFLEGGDPAGGTMMWVSSIFIKHHKH